MNIVLVRMAHFAAEPAVWCEVALPNITTLKALSNTIQDVFGLGSEGIIEYEMFGCRAPSGRARLRDLIVSGITRFRYLQCGRYKQQVEIVIVSLPYTHPERSIAR